MSVLADYYDLLMPELPGCPTAMVNLHLIQTARQFCQDTSAWVIPCDDITVLATTSKYELFPAVASAELVRITRLTFGNTLLWTRDDLDDCNYIYQTYPHYRRHEPPFTLTDDLLYVTFTAQEMTGAAGTAKIVAAVKPKMTANDLPDLLMSQYSEAIRCGTLARLMIMSKKKWTDRELAMQYRRDWNAACNFAAYQAQGGNTQTPLRVRTYG